MFLGLLTIFLGNCGYQSHKEHRKSREIKRKFAEQRAQGRGMRLADGEVMPWGISESDWKTMHEEWLRTHNK